ncbi:MAG: hypothetical protein ACRC1P_00310 [Cellulosilyticaceae bacterium]
MFKQKYGVSPSKLLVWFGIYLGTAVFAYIKLFQDASIAFWLVLIVDNILTIGMKVDDLMDEAMEEVKEGIEVWIFLIGTVIGTIMLIALFFINIKLALILTLTEIITLIIHKRKSSPNS